jgi:hypothetical protein
VGEDVLRDVGNRNTHALKEVCQHVLIVKASLFLFIGGGGVICANTHHFDNTPTLSHIRNKRSKTIFFSVELVECFDTQKNQTAHASLHDEPGSNYWQSASAT